MNNTVRYILGYVVGATLFLVLIPYGLYGLSKIESNLYNIVFIKMYGLRIVISIPLLIIGMIFALWSNISLFFTGKGGPTDAFGVSLSPQTKILVTNGPYKYSRNPMVFGAFSLYFSVAVFLNSLLCLISVIIFYFLAIFYLKFSEEKRLLKDFGKQYTDYRKSVSMIIPLKWIQQN